MDDLLVPAASRRTSGSPNSPARPDRQSDPPHIEPIPGGTMGVHETDQLSTAPGIGTNPVRCHRETWKSHARPVNSGGPCGLSLIREQHWHKRTRQWPSSMSAWRPRPPMFVLLRSARPCVADEAYSPQGKDHYCFRECSISSSVNESRRRPSKRASVVLLTQRFTVGAYQTTKVHIEDFV